MIVLYVVLGIIAVVGLGYAGYNLFFSMKSTANLNKLGPEAPTLTIDGYTFRDLNKNGSLDPYEDSRLPTDERVADLLSQMTLEEKAGMMFITMMGMNKDGTPAERLSLFNQVQTSEFIAVRLMNHFNILEGTTPASMAKWYNTIQKLAERTRLGIPVTIASDPRHAFTKNPIAGLSPGAFSQWPEPLGLAATRDMDLIKEFGDIARREYLAVGIRVALHPMVDLATEPRWGRINHTFGEDAELSGQCATAYITGFQGEGISPDSVICMTKHFPGAGPQKDGEDAHFEHGKEQVYPGTNFDYHLRSFEAAFEAGTGQIMPYYGQPIGVDGIEEVGFGFNKSVITGLLREKYGFDGVVCTDWNLLTPMKVFGITLMPPMAWGVEDLDTEGRVLKALEAGVDQFGGEFVPNVLVDLVRNGKLDESRLDQSVRRLLRDKFRLGLFDNPYVDQDAAPSNVGQQEFLSAGEQAQRKAFVLLKNSDDVDGTMLPLKKNLKIYIEDIEPEIASRYGQVVKTVEEADVAILRISTPYEPRKGLFERFFHAGDLDFKAEEKERLLKIIKRVPTVVDIYLERPAVIPEIAEHSAALVANFGATDDAALDVIFGNHSPTGKLPFELPSSMEAVRKQQEDMPYDTENPLFPFGFGLTYN